MPALTISTTSEQQDESTAVPGTKTPKKSSPDVEAKIKKRLNRILKRDENKICLDCSKPNPKWSALLSLPLQSPTHDKYERQANSSIYIGGLCCLECSGAHRRLGTHISFIRSVELDSMTDSEIRALEVGGNTVVNSIFEGRLLSGRISQEDNSISVSIQKKDLKPDASSGQKQREHFIKHKYEKKTYLDAVALSRFQKKSKNIVRSPSMGNGQEVVLSPTLSSSSSSTPEPPSSNAPLQLQVFTSSPRTLAMIEKYLNPKPKKHFLNKRLRLKKKYLLRKKRGIKSSLQNLVKDGSLGINTNMNIMQTRSEDLESVHSSYSASINTSCSDCNSMCSARSTMSEMLRRPNWSLATSRKKGSAEKPKMFRKHKVRRVSLDDDVDEDQPAPSPRKKGGLYYSKVRLSPKYGDTELLSTQNLMQEGGESEIKFDASLLDIVDEAASYSSPRASSKKKKRGDTQEEIRTLALWSRSIDKAMKRMFKKVTPQSPRQGSSLFD